MNLQQLYYFKTIAELEHYTKASEELSVSQSSLSHAIQGLEEEVGAKLFVRSGRNITLTKYGSMLLPYVGRALGTLEAGLSALKHAIDPDTGSVTIACFPSLAQFVPDIIVRYISETNRVNVHIQTNQEATYYILRERLLAGRVDIVFATEMKDPRIACSPIGTHGLTLLVPEGHRLAERGERSGVDLRELDGEDYIAYSRESQLRRQQDAFFRRMDIHPNITMETDQDIIIYGLVASGHGVAITPWPLGGTPYNVKIIPLVHGSEKDSAKDGSKNVTGTNTISRRKLYMLWNREAYMPAAAECFRDFIMEHGAVFDEYRARHSIG